MSKPVVWKIVHQDGSESHAFECPGCGQNHWPYTSGPKAWGFNGDLVRPTFTPSLLVRWTEGPEHTPRVCHSFIRDGQIEFLSDCTHALAGKTVPLAPVE